jgi:hypothetical protein
MVMFTACGDSNPFIGDWKMDMSATRFELSKDVKLLDDIDLRIKFTNDKIVVSINGEVYSDSFISYKKNPDDTWSTCQPDGTNCDKVVFLDKNTMRMPTVFGDAILKRI